MVVKTAHLIQEGDYQTKPQDSESEIKLAPKIFKEDCKIDWNQESKKVIDFIRGLSPYPAAWCEFENKTLKVFNAEIVDNKKYGQPGDFKSDGKSFLEVTTMDGKINILELQLEGKKRMLVKDFLMGYQIQSI